MSCDEVECFWREDSELKFVKKKVSGEEALLLGFLRKAGARRGGFVVWLWWNAW
jgi:hypothetical protein